MDFNSFRTAFLALTCLGLVGQTSAQVSESCDCIVDTVGYSSFIQTLNPDENAPFQFHVHGTFAVAYGVIDGTTPGMVQGLINNHPAVTTIVMHSCPGSDDDTANLQASQLLYNQGYKMYLPVDGFIASGAVDMFVGGSTRVVDVTPDAVGVHSWSDGQNDATDFPVGHPNHLPYINYYVSVGFTQQEAEDFYYFTINAAPAAGIHFMTEPEIDQYKIRTCRYSTDPTYSVSQSGASLVADLGGATYQWLDCANGFAPVSGETAQTFIPPGQSGTFAVLITESACTDTSACFTISGVGVIENGLSDNLSVYPNPTGGQVSVDLGGRYASVTIQLYDFSGKVVGYETFNDMKVPVLSLPDVAGIYLLRVEAGDAQATIRLVRE